MNRENMSTIVFGTSGLGNLFTALPFEEKKAIVRECLQHSAKPVMFDSAGKYGAGLALETLGKCLKELGVSKDNIHISNKLGWLRTALQTDEPTFEPGVWKDLHHDAIQKISYEGILECYEQGNSLLNGYYPQWVSVHDPDEYLASAKNQQEEKRFYENILGAYQALAELKKQGKVSKIGIGAKDWRIIERIHRDVELDWVMFANSLTIMKHPKELITFIGTLNQQGIKIINSAVFHSGFLVGTNYYDYRLISPDTVNHNALFNWRNRFFELCDVFDIKPAEACVQFALNIPGIKSIALNTTKCERVKTNIELASAKIPGAFWEEMKDQKLISQDYPFFFAQGSTTF